MVLRFCMHQNCLVRVCVKEKGRRVLWGEDFRTIPADSYLVGMANLEYAFLVKTLLIIT